MASETPCTACSWSPKRQARSHYNSNVKIFYECSDTGIWSIGSELIVKERRNSRPPSFEAQNMRFVKENTSIPVPTIIADWVENQRHFLVVKRVPGKPLKEIWSTLTDNEKDGISKQAASYLRELSKLQASRMESLDGMPVWDPALFGDDFKGSHGPLSLDDELFAEMTKTLSDVPKRALQRLRKRMPTAGPYTFTHGDMNISNFIVNDGNLTGIINWEASGYFPVWRESVGALITSSLDPEDMEWKKLLLQHIPRDADALEFFMDLYCLRHPFDDESRERARKFLEESV